MQVDLVPVFSRDDHTAVQLPSRLNLPERSASGGGRCLRARVRREPEQCCGQQSIPFQVHIFHLSGGSLAAAPDKSLDHWGQLVPVPVGELAAVLPLVL